MSDLLDTLGDKVTDLARELLGDPNRRPSTKNTWCYGRKGSLKLEVSGPKRGLWYDHKAGQGGCLLLLICREKGFSDGKDADAWARQWLGWPEWDSGHKPKAPSLDVSALLKAKPQPKPDPALEFDKELDAKRQRARQIWTVRSH